MKRGRFILLSYLWAFERCGAFGGDPAMASATAKSAILRYGSGFDKIVFAVPNSGRQSQANFEAFQATFSV